MQMLYNSDAFVVVRFDLEAKPPTVQVAPTGGAAASVAEPSTTPTPLAVAAPSGGPRVDSAAFEIVDKHSRKEIFLSGLMAQAFQQGAQALSENNPTPEDWDAYIEPFTLLAQQPVVMH